MRTLLIMYHIEMRYFEDNKTILHIKLYVNILCILSIQLSAPFALVIAMHFKKLMHHPIFQNKEYDIHCLRTQHSRDNRTLTL